MPNRTLPDCYRTSPAINRLSDFGDRLYIRLHSIADDYGRFDANPCVVRSLCFPASDNLPLKKIEKALEEMLTAAPDEELPLITVYRVKGRVYGALNGWLEHQRHRNSKPKFPGPKEGEILNPRQVAAGCGESPQVAASSVSDIRIPYTDIREPITSAATSAPARFEKFWETFPARNGKKLGKSEAKAQFLKLSEADQELVLQAARNFSQSQRVKEGIGIPDPARFLYRQRPVPCEPWRDWLEPEKPTVQSCVNGHAPTPKPTCNGNFDKTPCLLQVRLKTGERLRCVWHHYLDLHPGTIPSFELFKEVWMKAYHGYSWADSPEDAWKKANGGELP